MEIKKSPRADIERKRLTGFLLGLIVSLSVMLVCFEYTEPGLDEEEFLDEFEDLEKEAEMITAITEQPEVAQILAQQQAAAPQKLVITETPEEKFIDAEQPLLNDKEKEGVAPTDAPDTDKPLTEDEKDREILDQLEQVPDSANMPKVLQPETVPDDIDPLLALPTFPGGWAAMKQWIDSQLQYPAVAQQKKITGVVQVSFVVGTDGKVSRVRIEQSDNAVFDREVLRVMALMPQWQPGKGSGANVPTKIMIPIEFKLLPQKK